MGEVISNAAVQLFGGIETTEGMICNAVLHLPGDPAVFPEPDRYDIRRPNSARHLAFARGPHFRLGAHLARMEATAAAEAMLGGLPGLALDPGHPSAPNGLIFLPPALRGRWG